MWTTFLRSLFIFFFVLLVMRFMGKREIGQLSVFDFVVSIMIADFAVLSIEDPNMPLINGLIPMLTMISAQILLSYLSLKSRMIRYIVDGKPTILIQNGKIQEREMKKQRYNMDDLLLQLREQNVANVADVEMAVLETSGELSVFLKEEKETLKKEDVWPEKRSSQVFRLPVPLVIDSQVQEDGLKRVGKSRIWLEKQLRKYGYQSVREVFFVSVDHTGKLYIDPRED
ncbi:DUF421 domain-containing protein [Paludifilum halophilum]|uniref:YetF C-terminal domain-containing protein n=1 Tax=Paludifilum halophilum TaxID=1642702 RepID=A0A235BC95_9BACL|nr:DUF421 domain-containing protein [Paludifilum halophilum]OYD09901.1 hypothetical protein CHM34_02700 [Paludifilum halophilum]